MKRIPYIAAIIGLSLLTGGSFAYAQNAIMVSDTATSTPTETAPNPFPLVEEATSTPASTEETPTTPATTTEVVPTSTQPIIEEPQEAAPAPKPTQKPIPKTAKVVEKENVATTTATSSLFMPLAPGTTLPGNIYRDAMHAPLSVETTLYLFVLAALCAVLGAFMVEKNRLDRLGSGIAALFFPIRSLPQPRAER